MPLTEKFSKKLEKMRAKVVWCCRFHPTNWWHEIGCPHQEWTKEQLLSALIGLKQAQDSMQKRAMCFIEENEKAREIIKRLKVERIKLRKSIKARRR